MLGMSPRQIVTMASIIETEAKLDGERPVVASVIYNRLRKDIPLAVDSSVIYASKLKESGVTMAKCTRAISNADRPITRGSMQDYLPGL